MRVTKKYFFQDEGDDDETEARHLFSPFLVWEKCAAVGLSSAAVEAFSLDQDITLQYAIRFRNQDRNKRGRKLTAYD